MGILGGGVSPSGGLWMLVAVCLSGTNLFCALNLYFHYDYDTIPSLQDTK